MVKEALVLELTDLFSGCAEASGFALYDLIYRPQAQRLVFEVLVDRPAGGITLGECATLCRQFKSLLEEKNIIAQDYILEVSSPGLDRRLKRPADYLWAKNKEVVFFLNDLVEGKCQWQGIICGADQNIVSVQIKEQILQIPLEKINKAQLVIV